MLRRRVVRSLKVLEILRSFFVKLLLIGLLLGSWPWGVPIKKAQAATGFCPNDQYVSQSRLQVNTTRLSDLVVCDSSGTTQEIFFDQKVGNVSADKMLGGSQYLNQGQLADLYGMQDVGTDRIFYIAVDRVNRKTVGYLWTKPRFGTYTQNSDYFPVVFDDVNKTTTNTALSAFLKFFIQQGTSQTVAFGVAGSNCDRTFDAYRGNDTTDGRDKYFFGYTGGGFQPINTTLPVNVNSNSASITLPGSPASETQLKRPSITFTYKHFLTWDSRGILFGTANNYFYFLASTGTDKHCNLAVRINDGSAEADVVAVSLDQIENPSGSGQGTGIFELGRLASFSLKDDTYRAFMNRLYTEFPSSGFVDSVPGHLKLKVLKPNDQGETQTVDELGGERILSGDNPAASTPPGEDPCASITTGSGFLGVLARPLCSAGFFLAGIAATIAGITFDWLKSAAGLQ